MTPAEVARARAFAANHPSTHRSAVPVAVGVQVPGEADDESVSLGELDEMLVPLDGLVARLRLLRGGRS